MEEEGEELAPVPLIQELSVTEQGAPVSAMTVEEDGLWLILPPPPILEESIVAPGPSIVTLQEITDSSHSPNPESGCSETDLLANSAHAPDPKTGSNVDVESRSVAETSAVGQSQDSGTIIEGISTSEDCVFCFESEKLMNVLRCFHAACKACLAEHLRDDNTIRCARCQVITADPGPGCSLLNALPTWPRAVPAIRDTSLTVSSVSAPSDGNGEESVKKSQPVTIMCEEEECEDFQEPAVAKCLDCDRSLCKPHSQTHTRSRQRRQHKVCPLNVGGGSSGRCLLHSSEKLTIYCHDCKALLCAACLKRSNVHNAHQRLPIEEAASAMKTKVEQSLMEGQASACDLQNRISRYDSAIALCQEKVVALSEAIAKQYDSHRSLISLQEEQLKKEIDGVYWKHVKVLEADKEQVQEALRQRQAALYLQKHLTSTDLLRTFARAPPSIVAVPPISHSDCLAVPGFEPVQGLSDLYSLQVEELTAVFKSHQGMITEGLKPIRLSQTRKSPNIHVNGNIATANTTKSHKYRSIGSDIAFQMLPRRFSIKINILTGLYLGFASPDMPFNRDRDWQHGDDFCGWTSLLDKIHSTRGGDLGLPWCEGDIIKLEVRPGLQIATAVHIRSGTEVTIAIKQGWIFRAELLDGASITLLQ